MQRTIDFGPSIWIVRSRITHSLTHQTHKTGTQLRRLSTHARSSRDKDKNRSKMTLYYHGFEKFIVRCAFEICSDDRSKRVTDVSIRSLFRMMDPRETIFRISPPSSTAIVTTQETISTKQEDENESVRLALRSELSRPLLRQLFARCSTSSNPRHVFLRLLWMSRCLFAAPEAAPRVWTIDLCDAIESANMYLARSSQEHHLAFWEAFVHAVTIISSVCFLQIQKGSTLSHSNLPSLTTVHVASRNRRGTIHSCVSRLVLKPFEESTSCFVRFTRDTQEEFRSSLRNVYIVFYTISSCVLCKFLQLFWNVMSYVLEFRVPTGSHQRYRLLNSWRFLHDVPLIRVLHLAVSDSRSVHVVLWNSFESEQTA